MHPDDVAMVQGWLSALDTPASKGELMMEITRCLSLTTARSRDEADLKLMLAALAEELQRMPADILRAGLRKWSRQEKWWPTLNEIIVICESCAKRRRSLAHWIGMNQESQRFWIDYYGRH